MFKNAWIKKTYGTFSQLFMHDIHLNHVTMTALCQMSFIVIYSPPPPVLKADWLSLSTLLSGGIGIDVICVLT